LEWKN